MILNGKELSETIKEELKRTVSGYITKPGLVVIQVGEDPASSIYVKNKKKLAEEIGLNFKHLEFGIIEQKELLDIIDDLNRDSMVDGIIVQLPLPKYLNEDVVLNAISKNKDVDGLSDHNMIALINDQDSFVPCTPLGIMKLLDRNSIDVSGKHVVIVGRSRLVGKPLSSILLNRNATVTVCHSKTVDLKCFTSMADILIVATGKPGLITSKMVKKGVVVIDVGINRINNKICGDIDYKKIAKKASYITPVPGGVGPMTVVMLMQNTIDSYEKKMNN